MTSQTKYLSKLNGTTVLIIGGSSGLGFGLAEACVEHQVARLILSSSREQKIDEARKRLKSSYPDSKTVVTGYAYDLSDETTLESNVEELFDRIEGTIDHVVFTAGDAVSAQPITEVDFQSVKQAGLVRFFAPFFVAKFATKHLSSGPTSSITLTTGGADERPLPGRPAATAYAAALHGLVRSLALDLKPVRANLISVGAIDTEIWNTNLGPNSRDLKPVVFKQLAEKAATGAVGQVDDAVESYLYVLKDKNVTGTVIRTDGGILLT